MTDTTAKEYLNSIGIDLNKTSLFTVIDEYVRQPDLCSLLENYANLKIEEYKINAEYPKHYLNSNTELNH